MADRQHGVVATWQLLALGLTQDDIDYRARIGRLHRIHRGVYAVGYRKLTPKGHRMAAVLAYGPDAVLSHRSAAAHWDIGQPSWKIEVTTPRSRRSRKGTRVHQATLHPEDITVHDGIPITSVARMILDLAARLNNDRLTNLIEDADRKELFDLKALERAMARRPHAPGIRRLTAVLAAYRGPADTRSKLERDFRALIVKSGLPEPQYNVLLAGLTVDVYWPEWKLVVELDGKPYHTDPGAFESDRIRDATLQKIDIRVLRVTGKRMDDEPEAVLNDVLALRRIS
ncbi:MAG TPA: type IV toxin-antitoxin system AbiEi family antitoxin domain-containing protein [Solirubrobacteraceae bacterium]|nr:type IV toxin-antitoxin system AbiEi family antitoxin domain-containing protein [Solirubrobacteraceae bacterium]